MISFTEGIYEELISETLHEKLSNLSKIYFIEQEELDEAEATKYLTKHVAQVLFYALNELNAKDKTIRKIQLCNDIIGHISNQIDLETNDLIVEKGKILRAIIERIGHTEQQLKKRLDTYPLSGLQDSSLFTGGASEISIDTEIERDIETSDRLLWIVSFIRWTGLRIFEDALRKFTERGGKLKVITTTYMGHSDIRAVEFLHNLPNTEIVVSYETKVERLHAKSYIFERNTGYDTAYIGSSNLSKSAMTKGLEWNVRATSVENPHILKKAKATFEYYWHSDRFEPMTSEGLQKFKEKIQIERSGNIPAKNEYLERFDLLTYQKSILDQLKNERERYDRFKNLIVAATGTGKTVVAAHDYKRFCNSHKKHQPNFLFVVHRKEILDQSIRTFRSVLRDRNFGEIWNGNRKPLGDNIDHLFISVQTLQSQESFFREQFENKRDYYEYIIIDETHHGAAKSYRFIFDFFEPKILLGLTATPERMDGKSLLPDYDHKIASEIRLHDALREKMLCPFQYFCISDESIDLSNATWTNGRYDISDLTERLSSNARATVMVDALEHYLSDTQNCKALCYCVSKEHAEFVDKVLTSQGYNSACLTSDRSDKKREALIKSFTDGGINYLCVVDIFNEGMDIPEIDTVLFLRPTESLTVFIQQLGRGLRIGAEKEILTVLDFVSHAHQKFNFADRFRALVGKTNQNIKKEIERGFPTVPTGCYIKLEKQAKSYILQNINDSIFDVRRIRSELEKFQSQTKLPLTLTNFLDFHHLDIRAIYKSSGRTWTSLKEEVGLWKGEKGEHYDILSRGLKRILHIDSQDYLRFIQNVLEDFEAIDQSDVLLKRYALMFYYDLWQKPIDTFGFKSIWEGLKTIRKNPAIYQEIKEIVEYLVSHINHTTTEVEYERIKLDRKARYSRDEVLCMIDKTMPQNAYPAQEGVVRNHDLNLEVLFVTLIKSDKDFSPTTQYDDYAISEMIFNWQSQNSASEETEMGQSYIKQEELGKEIWLFVREEKKDEFGLTMPYEFLGPVIYKSHEGGKPMNIKWKLEEPMSPYLYKKAAKMAIG